MRRLTIALAISLAACGESPFDIARAPDAYRIEPPAEWAEWYTELEACGGLEGHFSRIRWWVVPGVGAWESNANGARVKGEWWPPHDIYIAELRMGHSSEQALVTHEMLHDLLRSPEHPRPPFGTCAPRQP